MCHFFLVLKIVHIKVISILGHDDFDYLIFMDEAHLLLESFDAGEVLYFEIVPEFSYELLDGGCLLRVYEVIGDDLPILECDFGEMFQYEIVFLFFRFLCSHMLYVIDLIRVLLFNSIFLFKSNQQKH